MTSSSVRMAAAMQGRAEFLAPDDLNGAEQRISAANYKLIHERLGCSLWISVNRSDATPGREPYERRSDGLRPQLKSDEHQLLKVRLTTFGNEGRCFRVRDVVFNREANVAIGFGKAADGFGLVDFGLEHDERDGNAAAGAFDGVHGGFAVDFAGAHQDADAALDQLGVLHVHVDHQVLVHIAEPSHGAGRDHVRGSSSGRWRPSCGWSRRRLRGQLRRRW